MRWQLCSSAVLNGRGVGFGALPVALPCFQPGHGHSMSIGTEKHPVLPYSRSSCSSYDSCCQFFTFLIAGAEGDSVGMMAKRIHTRYQRRE